MKEALTPGITLYFVIENLADSSLNREPYHYEIVSGEISEIRRFANRRKKEYVVQTFNRMGRRSVLKHVMADRIGKEAFLSLDEAEEEAERATENHEQAWWWAVKNPLARPWRGVKA